MEFPYVRKGQKIEIPTAAFHNAIVDVLRLHMNTRRGAQDGTGTATKESFAPRRTIEITASTDLEKYSIFTIAGLNPFNRRMPAATSKKVDAQTPSNAVYVTNFDLPLGEGARGICWILGDEFPRLAVYGGEQPAGSGTGSIGIGDQLGVIPGFYTISEEYTGLTAVSSLEEDDNLIWVVRTYGGGEGNEFVIGKVTSVPSIGANSYGTVEKHNEFWSPTGISYDVYNPHDVDLDNSLKVRWSHYPGWDDWIVEPWHYTTC